jgi:hypothetical protein
MSSAPAASPKQISEIMRLLLDSARENETTSIGQILILFGVRGFAFLILILALLNIVIFMVPFSSIVFGVPMIILAAQMVLGFRAPIFPRVVRRQKIQRAALVQGLERAIYGIEKIERYIKPRFLFLTHPVANRIHGLMALVMAIMVSIPIPFFSFPPSLVLIMLAIGMLQRDGIFILLAYAVGIWCVLLFKSLGHLAHSLTHSS